MVPANLGSGLNNVEAASHQVDPTPAEGEQLAATKTTVGTNENQSPVSRVNGGDEIIDLRNREESLLLPICSRQLSPFRPIRGNQSCLDRPAKSLGENPVDLCDRCWGKPVR